MRHALPGRFQARHQSRDHAATFISGGTGRGAVPERAGAAGAAAGPGGSGPAATDVLAGFAAALYSTVSPDEPATVAETESFLDAYGEARGRAISTGELQRAWAAGVWTRAYDAKYQHVCGRPVVSLAEDEARDRLRRAGVG